MITNHQMFEKRSNSIFYIGQRKVYAGVQNFCVPYYPYNIHHIPLITFMCSMLTDLLTYFTEMKFFLYTKNILTDLLT